MLDQLDRRFARLVRRLHALPHGARREKGLALVTVAGRALYNLLWWALVEAIEAGDLLLRVVVIVVVVVVPRLARRRLRDELDARLPRLLVHRLARDRHAVRNLLVRAAREVPELLAEFVRVAVRQVDLRLADPPQVGVERVRLLLAFRVPLDAGAVDDLGLAIGGGDDGLYPGVLRANLRLDRHHLLARRLQESRHHLLVDLKDLAIA